MKKILAILMSALLICAFPVMVFAEEIPAEEVAVEEVAVDVTEEVVDDPNDLSVDDIVNYVQSHLEEISVIVSLIISALYAVGRNKKLNGSIAKVNNNAVKMTENNLTALTDVSLVVTQYKEAIASLLDEVRRNDTERASLEESLAEVTKYLKATRLANVELANEVAELLILANIPNSKKDELYARHLAAVNAIAEAEAKASEEVKENDEDEA